jgi:hypothetical protein
MMNERHAVTLVPRPFQLMLHTSNSHHPVSVFRPVFSRNIILPINNFDVVTKVLQIADVLPS